MIENIFYLFSTCVLPIILFPLKLLLLSVWDVCSYFFIDVILGIQNTMIYKSEIIDRGFILVNNRSKIDIIFNTYILKGVVLGRSWLNLFCMGIIGVLEERIIFCRKVNNLIRKMEKQNADDYGNRVIIYGKNSILKDIYDNGKYPIQIYLSKGNLKICSILSEPIYPGDYRKYSDFIDKIETDWDKNYNEIAI